MRIAYIGREHTEYDGGAMVSQRNVVALQKISSQLSTFYIDHKNMKKKLACIMRSKPSGWSKTLVGQIETAHARTPFHHIFIDHSMSGGFAPLLSHLNIPISVFFHNVEYLYYQDKAKVDGALNKLMVHWAKQNEKKAVEYAQHIICLTPRDSQNLEKYYQRPADLIAPTSFADRYTGNTSPLELQQYHLFIGSNFFANVQGLRWYIEKVLDHIDSTLVVIGKGMEFLTHDYPNKRIEVLGFVQELEPYYLHADFVINPVFLGSGMKTKTIEALMYGKTIFGTTEAFVGLAPELMQQSMIQLCDSADTFIKRIKAYKEGPWNQEARNSFLKYYDIKTTEALYRAFFTPH